jgi:tetratricopeptide (TPR) repeat protein
MNGMATAAELFELAVRYHQGGDLGQAENLYRQVLAADPSHAAALSNLGVALQVGGREAEAIACLRRAVELNPHQADAHNNLGNALKDHGNPAEAVACFRQALLLDPRHAYAHNNLGNALKDLGRLVEAADCYRHALYYLPNYGNAYYNLANVLKDQGQPAGALDCYQQALRLNPRHAEAHNNLGILLKDQGRVAEAIACYRQALSLAPHYADAHNNLGIALRDHGELADAVACFQEALRLRPSDAELHNNLGIALMRLGHFDQAHTRYEEALRLKPAHGMALWNRSLLRLLQGDFVGGWPDYERRWTQTDMVLRSFDRPRWDGSSLEGKTILIHAEQGLGDTIHFLRYLPLVKRRGGRVLFECQPVLLRLLANIDGADQLLPAGTALPSFDVEAPLLSLPGIFATTLATIPAHVPYLRAESALVERWREELEALKGLKVGIAWQGNPNNQGDLYRSCPLKYFEMLANVEGVRLISLQKGPGSEQVPSSGAFPVLDLSDRLDREASFIDTAAVIMNLDLVIAVDSAVAHLAGALGVPVWLLLPFVPDWRWLLERSDSPWYPTMRLFRQAQLGNWQEVFRSAAAALGDLIAGGKLRRS